MTLAAYLGATGDALAAMGPDQIDAALAELEPVLRRSSAGSPVIGATNRKGRPRALWCSRQAQHWTP